MRPPSNERPHGISERTCVVSRAKGARSTLIRLALSPDGVVAPDVRARAPGRGAWIGVDKPTLTTALAKGKLRGALGRAFKDASVTVPPELVDSLETALQRDALDRMGLESRGGALIVGSERIDEAARKGTLHLLLHASDASGDGVGKLAQAWRVGSDREEAWDRADGQPRVGRRGVVLPVDRTILSMALGRENVVHIGVTDARAAARVAAALDRWLGFIGSPTTGLACEGPSPAAGPHGQERVLDEGLIDE